MENILNAIPTAVAPGLKNAPMQELATYHQQLLQKHSSLPEINVASPFSDPLIAFNGYYSVDGSQGGFFAVDTNMVVTNSSAAYDICLLISLDGKTSARFAFTGTFENNVLQQGDSTTPDDLCVDLTFSRTDGSTGTVATISGTICLPGGTSQTVSGATYNNPIPCNLFNGNYATSANPTEVAMQIQDNNGLSYQYPGTDTMAPVTSYVYNMNMYFFSFDNGTPVAPATESYRLIMGTAVGAGLVCNCMVIDLTGAKTTTSTTVKTIPAAPQVTPKSPNLNSAQLAAFSGYYALNSSPGAFFAIQGQYMDFVGEDYVVLIAYSMNGTTSTALGFESSGMTFENNLLTINDSTTNTTISLTFGRGYDPATGSLATISGTINGVSVTGSTFFNPVPLSDFGGAPMINDKGISLTVVSDDEVIYTGKQFTTVMQNILYVPNMYILAYPAINPMVVMSFGTDGLQGNACIITDNNNIYTVTAIPTPGG